MTDTEEAIKEDEKEEESTLNRVVETVEDVEELNRSLKQGHSDLERMNAEYAAADELKLELRKLSEQFKHEYISYEDVIDLIDGGSIEMVNQGFVFINQQMDRLDKPHRRKTHTQDELLKDAVNKFKNDVLKEVIDVDAAEEFELKLG
ncbi:MAG: hypothetical protein GQ570_05295 [Helicobacteraceae bacterium]|nr:hypothetical protein [Helicobacteraceae bacterium]